MSLLLGSPNERLSLSRAVDALGEAARRAGRPSLLWLVGALYPSLNLNLDLVRGVMALVREFSGIDLPMAGGMGGFVALFAPGIPGVNLGKHDSGGIGSLLITLPFILIAFRMIVGLARVSDPLYDVSAVEQGSSASPRPVHLRQVWAEGKGLGLAAFGLWGMLLLLLFGAMLVLIAPVVALLNLLDLTRFSALYAGMLSPVLLLTLVYAAVLMVLNQLALHSLAHNRRGAASALTHAWRLVRASPLGTLRATLVDFVLFLSVLIVGTVLDGFFGGGLRGAIVLALLGFAGVARAGYWARTYRALGGMGHADRVPGL